MDSALKEIVLVANSAWYLRNFRSSTIAALRQQGHGVRCLVPESGDVQSMQALSELGAQVESFRLSTVSTSYVLEAIALLSLIRALCRRRPALVFSFNPKSNLYVAIACQILSIAYVPNISGVGMTDELKGFKGRLYRLAMGIFLRKARWVFFQNVENMRTVIGRGWACAERCTLLPGSGVELERFSPPDPGAPVGAVTVFLMASRLLKQKGVGEYLAAAECLSLEKGKGMRFLLAGEADDSGRCIEVERLEAFASNPDCEYLGQVEDMPALLRRVDCVVLPSYYPEGIPRILIEAIACGRPVITTEQPGCREVVEPGVNGYRVAPGSVEALLEAMRAFLSLPMEQVAEMGVCSRRLAEARFDVNKVIDHYLHAVERFADVGRR